jgi:hypothetical protein
VITNQDVKLVLSAYRPNGADARDAFFEEALEQAKRDPELMEWFVKQRVFDDVIFSKLRTIEPPAGLNLEILAGLRTIGEPRRAVGHWLAVAAALLVAMMVLSYNGFFEPLKLDRLDEFCSDCLVQFNARKNRARTGSAKDLGCIPISRSVTRLRSSIEHGKRVIELSRSPGNMIGAPKRSSPTLTVIPGRLCHLANKQAARLQTFIGLGSGIVSGIYSRQESNVNAEICRTLAIMNKRAVFALLCMVDDSFA